MAKVLLVEDNEFNRDMLSRRLNKRGWEVAHAHDGPQALVRALGEPYDLILMDMSLPSLDGWNLTQMLKTDDRTRDTPIIALTAHAMNGDRERALEAGCNEFETKPIEFGRLLQKMHALVGDSACT
jgi:two-component system, cell cycle response regulator DivK